MALSGGFISGKVGYVVVSDDVERIEYPLGEWQFPVEAEFIRRNNFKSRGYQEGVSGFKKVQFTIKGPYALGENPLIVGETYRFYLGLESTDLIEFFADGHVSKIDVTNNAEQAPEISYTCDSIGEFSLFAPE